jgi:hypothetical protein
VVNPSGGICAKSPSTAFTTRVAATQHWVGEALSLSYARWLKPALGAALNRGRPTKHSFQTLPQLRSRQSQVRPQLDQGSIPIPPTQRTELGHRDAVV